MDMRKEFEEWLYDTCEGDEDFIILNLDNDEMYNDFIEIIYTEMGIGNQCMNYYLDCEVDY